MAKRVEAGVPGSPGNVPVQPHKVGWFWRLLGLYGGLSHPISAGVGDEDWLDTQVQDWFSKYLTLARDRKERYRIFAEMDTFGLVQSILDVYAEEATQKDYDRAVRVWVESKSQKMVNSAEECFRNLQMEDRLPHLVRRLCKNGDAFQRFIYTTGKGLLAWKHVQAGTLHRLEDKFSRLIGFRQDGQKYRGPQERNVSWPWDYVHFRLLGKDEESGYGTSVLEAMFRPWRQLILAEDSVLMYRIRRAPDRNLVLVDVGNMEEHEAAEFLNSWRKRFRKYEFIDPSSPNYKKQYNPLTPLEDVFIAQRKGSETRVESLSGSGTVGELYDLDHFRNKFFGAARVPKAYMGYEGEIDSKATLVQQDIRFARTIKRIQSATMYGVRQALEIHYTLLPTSPEDTTWDFSKKENAFLVQMSPISYLDEWERLELVELRYRIVEAMSRLAQDLQLDPRVWAIYILLNYAKLPEDLVMKLIQKTPDEPMAAAGGGEGGGFESILPTRLKDAIAQMEPKQRKLITEDMRSIRPPGFYPLSKTEQLEIARMLHESAEVRKIVGNIAYYHEDDMINEALRQTDPSTLPPTVNGVILVDGYADDPEAKTLQEDLDALRGKQLNG